MRLPGSSIWSVGGPSGDMTASNAARFALVGHTFRRSVPSALRGLFMASSRSSVASSSAPAFASARAPRGYWAILWAFVELVHSLDELAGSQSLNRVRPELVVQLADSIEHPRGLQPLISCIPGLREVLRAHGVKLGARDFELDSP